MSDIFLVNFMQPIKKVLEHWVNFNSSMIFKAKDTIGEHASWGIAEYIQNHFSLEISQNKDLSWGLQGFLLQAITKKQVTVVFVFQYFHVWSQLQIAKYLRLMIHICRGKVDFFRYQTPASSLASFLSETLLFYPNYSIPWDLLSCLFFLAFFLTYIYPPCWHKDQTSKSPYSVVKIKKGNKTNSWTTNQLPVTEQKVGSYVMRWTVDFNVSDLCQWFFSNSQEESGQRNAPLETMSCLKVWVCLCCPVY